MPVTDFFLSVLDAETYRRAAIIRLALILYHRDHGEYPRLLSELVPDYLAQLPTDPFTANTQPLSYAAAGTDAILNRYENNGTVRVERNTPFVWSVGPTNVRLKRRELVSYNRDVSDPSADLVEIRSVYYVLQGERDDWYRGDPLIFPLPKIGEKEGP